jgi:hypothetical protein
MFDLVVDYLARDMLVLAYCRKKPRAEAICYAGNDLNSAATARLMFAVDKSGI